MGLAQLGIHPKLGASVGTAAALGRDSLRRVREEYERNLAAGTALEDALMMVILPSFLVMQTWNADVVTPEAGMRYASMAMERSEAAGNQVGEVMARWALGTALLRLGQIEDAIGSLEDALARSEGVAMEGLIAAAVAEALALNGDPRARELIDRAQQLRASSWQGAWLDTRISRVLRMVDGEKAAGAIERALDNGERLMKQTETFGLAPVLLVERAELAGLRGNAALRERFLNEAIAEYERLEAPDEATRLRALL